MVSAAGPVLVDFGIAMGEGESHVTRTGLVMGTPGFIAPEIIDGAESDDATDWWSVRPCSLLPQPARLCSAPSR